MTVSLVMNQFSIFQKCTKFLLAKIVARLNTIIVFVSRALRVPSIISLAIIYHPLVHIRHTYGIYIWVAVISATLCQPTSFENEVSVCCSGLSGGHLLVSSGHVISLPPFLLSILIYVYFLSEVVSFRQIQKRIFKSSKW